MARINSTQANIRGPINRDENLIDHYLFVTLVWGSFIGAIALLLWMFQGGAWSERRWPSVSNSVPAARHLVPVQQAQPTRPVPAPTALPQVTVNVDRIQVDATTVQNVTTPPSAPVPGRELTPEERSEKLKQELRREYGAR